MLRTACGENARGAAVRLTVQPRDEGRSAINHPTISVDEQCERSETRRRRGEPRDRVDHHSDLAGYLDRSADLVAESFADDSPASP